MKNPSYDVAVIGGGAAGMAAAIRAAELGRKTVLLEKNPFPGKKLAATGNGRCNLMNTGAPRYYGDSRFAQQVMNRCGKPVQQAFWHRLGVLLTEESQGRVYPLTLQAATVTEALKRALNQTGVRILTRTEVTRLIPEAGGFTLTTADGVYPIRARKVIVACGSAACPRLGGTDSGYRLLAGAGHRITEVFPALCGILTDRRSVSGLDGLRVHGTVTVFSGEKALHRETGEILFSEDGISGICVMQCARFVTADHADRAELDLTPEELRDPFRFRTELQYRFHHFGSETAEALLNGILPGKLGFAICKQAGLPMRGEPLQGLEPDRLDDILQAVQHYRLMITGVRGMDSAQVAAGGADCREFDPDTMESRSYPGLFAAGEVLDVDGDCGGFNLMFAFGSGLTAGENAAK